MNQANWQTKKCPFTYKDHWWRKLIDKESQLKKSWLMNKVVWLRKLIEEEIWLTIKKVDWWLKSIDDLMMDTVDWWTIYLIR